MHPNLVVKNLKRQAKCQNKVIKYQALTKRCIHMFVMDTVGSDVSTKNDEPISLVAYPILSWATLDGSNVVNAYHAYIRIVSVDSFRCRHRLP